MLSHITIGISNLDRAFAFYTRILAPPNYVLKFHEPTPVSYTHLTLPTIYSV